MNLHQLGYWVEIYRKAGDRGWDQLLAWNLATAAVAAAGARVGAACQDVKWRAAIDLLVEGKP